MTTDYVLQPIYAQLLSDESPDPESEELELDEEDEEEDSEEAEGSDEIER